MDALKTIFFVRHGSTPGIEDRRFQEFDTPLSDTGRQQARKASEYFKNQRVDLILSSTMKRASETAEIIKETANLTAPIEYIDLYHEALRPTAIRDKNRDLPEVIEILKKLQENFGNNEWRHSDEENFFDLKNRALKALEYVSTRSEEVILVSTHATFLKVMLAAAVFGETMTVENMLSFTRTFRVENTSISKFIITDQGWKISSWNDHGHLLDEIE